MENTILAIASSSNAIAGRATLSDRARIGDGSLPARSVAMSVMANVIFTSGNPLSSWTQSPTLLIMTTRRAAIQNVSLERRAAVAPDSLYFSGTVITEPRQSAAMRGLLAQPVHGRQEYLVLRVACAQSLFCDECGNGLGRAHVVVKTQAVLQAAARQQRKADAGEHGVVDESDGLVVLV